MLRKVLELSDQQQQKQQQEQQDQDRDQDRDKQDTQRNTFSTNSSDSENPLPSNRTPRQLNLLSTPNRAAYPPTISPSPNTSLNPSPTRHSPVNSDVSVSRQQQKDKHLNEDSTNCAGQTKLRVNTATFESSESASPSGYTPNATFESTPLTRTSTNNTTTAALPYSSATLNPSKCSRHYHPWFLVDKMVIVSGGTGANSIVGAFTKLAEKCNFVLPISDDGGSSSEIIRVLGGPSVGDIRSRLVRLIPRGQPCRHHHHQQQQQHQHLDGAADQVNECDYEDEQAQKQSTAIANLLSHRLSGSTSEVKTEWRSIIEGRHPLWRNIGQDRKECIRSFLVHFDYAILQRARKRFSFKNCSVGNSFLSGAVLFFRNIESAIFLFSTLTGINPDHRCTPVINTTSVATIGAELEDGNVIVGQCQISHPPPGRQYNTLTTNEPRIGIEKLRISSSGANLLQQGGIFGGGAGDDDRHGHDIQSADEQIDDDPYSQPSPTDNANMIFVKDSEDPEDIDPERQIHSIDAHSQGDFDIDRRVDEELLLDDVCFSSQSLDPLQPSKPSNAPPENIRHTQGANNNSTLLSRVQRIFYINAYGQQVYPKPNPKYLEDLDTASVLVYSCGSLFTSIIPCLCIRDVATHIVASPTLKYKILLINGVHDRETPRHYYRFVSDYVEALYRASITCMKDDTDSPQYASNCSWKPKDFVTHVLYLDEGTVEVDKDELNDMGITCVPVKTYKDEKGRPLFEESNVYEALKSILS